MSSYDEGYAAGYIEGRKDGLDLTGAVVYIWLIFGAIGGFVAGWLVCHV